MAWARLKDEEVKDLELELTNLRQQTQAAQQEREAAQRRLQTQRDKQATERRRQWTNTVSSAEHEIERLSLEAAAARQEAQNLKATYDQRVSEFAAALQQTDAFDPTGKWGLARSFNAVEYVKDS